MKKTALFLLSLFVLPLGHADPIEIERWQTSQGTPVVFYSAMEVPILDIRIGFRAGSAYDGEAYGLSALTTDLMNQGNAGLSATKIAEALEETGAQYNGKSTLDMANFQLRTLVEKKALTPAIATFTKIITQPDFKPQPFTRVMQQQIMAIRQSNQSPDKVANQAFFDLLYQDHPYGHATLGTEQTVARITAEQVKAFYQQHFTPKNGVLVLVGAIRSKQAHQIAEEITKKLPQGPSLPFPHKATAPSQSIQKNIAFPSSQTMVRIGQLGIDHHSPDYMTLKVGNYILGGGSLVSRLAHEVREKRGLTYGVYSQFIPLPGDGPFLISLSTRNDQANQAANITLDTVNRFLQEGPSDKELSDAKQYLTGSFPLSLASNNQIAEMLLNIAFYQLPDDYLATYVDKIKAVNKQTIHQTFKTAIHPEQFLQIKVGQG